MSRVIKFRAWDGTRNNWLHSTARAISMIGETVLFGAVLQRPDDSFVRLSELNEVEWEQFTGLLDKNGTEIYEGDIVFWPHTSSKNLLVQYNKKDCAFVADSKDGVATSWLDNLCEVIGNTNENPELLEN